MRDFSWLGSGAAATRVLRRTPETQGACPLEAVIPQHGGHDDRDVCAMVILSLQRAAVWVPALARKTRSAGTTAECRAFKSRRTAEHTEGGAWRHATGLENRTDLTVEGSTPSPSANDPRQRDRASFESRRRQMASHPDQELKRLLISALAWRIAACTAGTSRMPLSSTKS